MGCSDCGAKGGCDARKGEQRSLFDELIPKLYPGVPTWGRPDDEARFGAGISRAEGQRLARSMSEVTKAPTLFRRGEPDDLCDFVWVLCVGRAPTLLEAREGGPLGNDASERVSERWIRVALSSVARVAALQEVELALDDGWVREAPRAGVFDPILLKRVQKLVALLEASSIRHLDFGLLDVPLDGADGGDYRERYGVEPRLVNFLFYAAPPTTARLEPLAGAG